MSSASLVHEAELSSSSEEHLELRGEEDDFELRGETGLCGGDVGLWGGDVGL